MSGGCTPQRGWVQQAAPVRGPLSVPGLLKVEDMLVDGSEQLAHLQRPRIKFAGCCRRAQKDAPRGTTCAKNCAHRAFGAEVAIYARYLRREGGQSSAKCNDIRRTPPLCANLERERRRAPSSDFEPGNTRIVLQVGVLTLGVKRESSRRGPIICAGLPAAEQPAYVCP